MISRLFIFLLLFTTVCGAEDISKKPSQTEEAGIVIPMDAGLPRSFKSESTPSLIVQAFVLSAFALIPFMVMLLTPFAKIVMVFSLLRNALGVQQIPPNQVINGISIILSIFVMFPVGLEMYKQASEFIEKHDAPEIRASPLMASYIVNLINASKEPLRSFLSHNTNPAHIKHFFKVAFKTSPDNFKGSIKSDDFIILIPSFITTQVKNGFEIGTLIFLPFFVIDVVVSNILLAMGMMMLSPVTISLPIKIFLLVMLDGWTLLTKGLLDGYKM